MTRSAPPPVIFDLDGTLIDSRRDLATAIDQLRAELALPALGAERVAAMVGEGARVLVTRALADAPAWGVTVELEGALERFLLRYDAVCLATTGLYPGVDDLLAELAAERRLGLLTNKPEQMTRKLLAHLGIDRYLTAVVAGDTLPTRKPDPTGMRALASRFAAPVGELTLVGDSLVDLATARAAECRWVLVGWGFLPVAVLETASGVPVATDCDALRRRLRAG